MSGKTTVAVRLAESAAAEQRVALVNLDTVPDAFAEHYLSTNLPSKLKLVHPGFNPARAGTPALLFEYLSATLEGDALPELIVIDSLLLMSPSKPTPIGSPAVALLTELRKLAEAHNAAVIGTISAREPVGKESGPGRDWLLRAVDAAVLLERGSDNATVLSNLPRKATVSLA